MRPDALGRRWPATTRGAKCPPGQTRSTTVHPRRLDLARLPENTPLKVLDLARKLEVANQTLCLVVRNRMGLSPVPGEMVRDFVTLTKLRSDASLLSL